MHQLKIKAPLVLLVVCVIVVNARSASEDDELENIVESPKDEPIQPKKGGFSWLDVVPAGAFSWNNTQSAFRVVNGSDEEKGGDGTPQKVSIIAVVFDVIVRQVKGLLLVTAISGKPHTNRQPREQPEPNIAYYHERELEEEDSGNETSSASSESDEAVEGEKKGPQKVSLVAVAFNAIVRQIQGLFLVAQINGNPKPGERLGPKIPYIQEREQEDDASGNATSSGNDETQGGVGKDQHSSSQKASVIALVLNAIVGQVQGLFLVAEVTPGSHPPKPTGNSSNAE